MARKDYAESARDESFTPGHAFEETKDRCPLDRMLREAGFEIVSRPAVGEPIWTLKKNRKIRFKESEALLRLQEKQK